MKAVRPAMLICLLAAARLQAQEFKSPIPQKAGFPQSIGMMAFSLPANPGELDQFLATGVKIWRRDFRWSWFEKQQGRYDFSFIDEEMAAVQKSGVTLLLGLGGRNELYPGYNGGPEFFPAATAPEQIPGYAAFAAAAAEHFQGKPVMFELGGEMDGACTPDQYYQWAKATAEAMRKADPNVVIVGPGSHEWAYDWNDKLFKLGFLKLVDIVAVHMYLGGDWKAPQKMPEAHEKDGRLTELKALVSKYSNGRDIPFANTEWGYRSYHSIPRANEDDDMQVSMTDQARYAVRSMLLSVLWDFRFNVWFTWILPTKTSGGYGIVDESGMPMPVYFALKNMAEQLPDSTLSRRINVESPDDYVLEFNTSKGKRWAVWTCGEPHGLWVPVGDVTDVVVTDLCGSRTFRPPTKDGRVNLAITGSVQYVRAATKED